MSENEKQSDPMTSAVPQTVNACGEAGFSLNWQMVDKHGASVQVTMRTAVVGEWSSVMTSRAIFVSKALEAGWAFPGGAKPQAAPTNGGSPIAKPAPKAQAAAGSSGSSKAVQELHVIKVEITPKPDSKAEIKFFTAGHKFPDLYATRTTAQWVEDLNWEESIFGAAAEYSEKLLVGYTLSDKLNTAGKPYKDIAYIKPDTF